MYLLSCTTTLYLPGELLYHFTTCCLVRRDNLTRLHHHFTFPQGDITNSSLYQVAALFVALVWYSILLEQQRLLWTEVMRRLASKVRGCNWRCQSAVPPDELLIDSPQRESIVTALPVFLQGCVWTAAVTGRDPLHASQGEETDETPESSPALSTVLPTQILAQLPHWRGQTVNIYSNFSVGKNVTAAPYVNMSSQSMRCCL